MKISPNQSLLGQLKRMFVFLSAPKTLNYVTKTIIMSWGSTLRALSLGMSPLLFLQIHTHSVSLIHNFPPLIFIFEKHNQVGSRIYPQLFSFLTYLTYQRSTHFQILEPTDFLMLLICSSPINVQAFRACSSTLNFRTFSNVPNLNF